MKYIKIKNIKTKDKEALKSDMDNSRSDYLKNHPTRDFSRYITDVKNSLIEENDDETAYIEIGEDEYNKYKSDVDFIEVEKSSLKEEYKQKLNEKDEHKEKPKEEEKKL